MDDDMDVIDLITPPSSPRQDEEIDLISPPSSPRHDDENSGSALGAPSGVKVEAAPEPSAKALGKRKALHPIEREPRVRRGSESTDDEDEDEEDDEDDEVMEADAAQQAARMQDDGMELDGEDDELQFVGRTGANALLDFPHARENCVANPFTAGNESSCCANCYCARPLPAATPAPATPAPAPAPRCRRLRVRRCS